VDGGDRLLIEWVGHREHDVPCARRDRQRPRPRPREELGGQAIREDGDRRQLVGAEALRGRAV
jgi:hypothetical protein